MFGIQLGLTKLSTAMVRVEDSCLPAPKPFAATSESNRDPTLYVEEPGRPYDLVQSPEMAERRSKKMVGAEMR